MSRNESMIEQCLWLDPKTADDIDVCLLVYSTVGISEKWSTLANVSATSARSTTASTGRRWRAPSTSSSSSKRMAPSSHHLSTSGSGNWASSAVAKRFASPLLVDYFSISFIRSQSANRKRESSSANNSPNLAQLRRWLIGIEKSGSRVIKAS